jgi:SAM-dependent methyltransferase
MLPVLGRLDCLVCPRCHGRLTAEVATLACERCDLQFRTNSFGYLEFVLERLLFQIDSTTDDYGHVQELGGARFFDQFLWPYVTQEEVRRVLDVGTGIGTGVSRLARAGYEAYGIDLPNLCRFWAKAGNDPQGFVCCESSQMPFPDGYFDLVYSLGVIEHVGTEIGHCTLSPTYWESRFKYARELIRVAKPSGRILISCPNKSFPIDIQHGPTDRLSPRSAFRELIWKKTKINIHPTWGNNHLLSYSETMNLFRRAGAKSFRPVALEGFLGLSSLRSGYLKSLRRLVELYLKNLPQTLRSTFLNPYMLIEIRR